MTCACPVHLFCFPEDTSEEPRGTLSLDLELKNIKFKCLSSPPPTFLKVFLCWRFIPGLTNHDGVLNSMCGSSA